MSDMESESSSGSGEYSFDEEDLCSSESEMATEPNSRVLTAEHHYGLESSLSELSLDAPEDGLSSSSATGLSTTSKQELIRQIHLRRHIDKLSKTLDQRESKVEGIRVKLSLCREHINNLLTREDSLSAQVAELEGSKAPSLGLLRAKLNKVRAELDSERNVELNIQNELMESELGLCEARRAAGQFQQADTLLTHREKNTVTLKARQAVKRLQAENQLVQQAQQTMRLNERLLCATTRECEQQTRLLLEQAKESQEKGKQFLVQTLEKRRQQDTAAQEHHRAHLDKRIKAMISLKKNIESSQSTMQAQQMLKSETARRKQVSEEKQRERVKNEGGNPDEAILRQHKVESFELSKESFLKKQTQRQVEIVNKLLEEEKTLKRAEKKLSKAHWHARQECPHPTKRLSSKTHHVRREGLPTHTSRALDLGNNGGAPAIKELVEGETPAVSPDNTEVPVESVAEPEIPGLWSYTQKQPQIKPEKSKTEIEKMNSAMEKLKKSHISKQIVAGREFKGEAFTAKPSQVVFKDFDVGKAYHKKVTLTNVSYSFNYCKLIGVTSNLKDFINIDFEPPGSLSAGLTCYLTVSFHPKVDEDLVGGIEMLSQTGPFTIPLHCLSKKCLVTADKTVLEFGRVCIGETVRRSLTLTNSGAIATSFTFGPATPSLQAVSESVVVVEGGQSDNSGQSSYSIMSNLETGPSRLDHLTVGGVEEKVSRSVGDLGSVSEKSLSWANDVGNEEASEHQSTQQDDYLDVEQAIVVGEVKEGTIAGFSSTTLQLLYSPLTPSQHSQQFRISFSHHSMSPITITGQGCGEELPVWVERESIDLQVCVLDRLYQDTVVLHNTTSVALRVSFQVPPPLQSHLEVLPRHGMVQAESSFSAQLKFTPKHSILDPSCQGYLRDSIFEIPIQVKVADQTQPVKFTVLAQVTPSELSFDCQSVDFGSSTTHESVVAALRITNNSILPQSFGFVGLPPCVDVQPGDGFGVILPEETLPLDLIFSPQRPQKYSFELTLKTEYDQTYKIPCTGLGVLPALKLSQNAISFSATALNDTKSATISVSNPRLGRLDSAVIRGAILPQGDKMFEFVVPEDIPIKLCPQVGTVPLGGSVSVRVELSPSLDREVVCEEALRLAKEEMARQAEESSRLEQEKLDQEQNNKKKAGKKGGLSQKSGLLSNSKNSLSSSNSKQLMSESNSTVQEPQPPEQGSDLWCQAEHNLLLCYTESCLQTSIPCFVSREVTDASLSSPQFRVEDTLYLELSAGIVRPGLVVWSGGGRSTVEYGSVGTGDCNTQTITLKNISNQQLQLTASALDPVGPFELRNSLRAIPPGQTGNLLLRFSPTAGGKFCEHLLLRYNNSSTLRLKLLGTGVEPVVSISPDSSTLDLGHAMAGDTVSTSIELSNNSPLTVRYQATLESSLPHAASNRRKQALPSRASNHSGQPPFSCTDSRGCVDSNKSAELRVSFRADHQSPSYSDTLHIDINGQRMFSIELVIKAWTNNMYVVPPTGPSVTSEEGEPLVLVFTHHLASLDTTSSESSSRGGKNKTDTVVTRELVVGTIKSSLVKKSAGDLTIENLPSSNPHSKYFSVNPAKLSIEAGTSKPVTFTFTPPADPALTSLAVNTNMTLKGDTTQVHKLLLRGLICE